MFYIGKTATGEYSVFTATYLCTNNGKTIEKAIEEYKKRHFKFTGIWKLTNNSLVNDAFIVSPIQIIAKVESLSNIQENCPELFI